MAIYHCSVKTVSRSQGRTSTAASAYRSGSEIVDDRTGQIHDYTRKSDVDHSEIIGSDLSRSELWNAAEKSEKRKDATVAREYEVAIPKELSRQDQIDLAREYGKWIHERHNVGVDLSVHNTKGENPHAHILTTTREVTPDGLGEKAAREWSDTKRKKHGLEGRKADLAEARERWSDLANHALERAGSLERIDHRSLEDQKAAALDSGDQEQAAKLDRFPTIKMGKQATQMERQGIETDRGDANRQIKSVNRERIEKALGTVKDVAVKATKTIGDKLREIADRKKAEREQKANDGTSVADRLKALADKKREERSKGQERPRDRSRDRGRGMER